MLGEGLKSFSRVLTNASGLRAIDKRNGRAEDESEAIIAR